MLDRVLKLEAMAVAMGPHTDEQKAHALTTACAGMTPIGTGMSNLFGEIDPGFEDTLREEPNKFFGNYAGLNFNGQVWYDGEQFCCEVWVFRVIQEILKADSLQGIMQIVSAKYGAE